MAESMAGTDSTQSAAEGGPAIILVKPQLCENIGTAARAMLNCGLTDMRLVAPRDNWLEERAFAAASGADRVLLAARVFDTTEAAIADLSRVWATTGRNRFMTKPVDTPRQAAVAIRGAMAVGQKCGLLFGPERTGLENDDVVLADTVLTVPLNPSYASLNLAQAVLLVGYEWFQCEAADALPPMTKAPSRRPTRRSWCSSSSTWNASWTPAASCAIPRSGR